MVSGIAWNSGPGKSAPRFAKPNYRVCLQLLFELGELGPPGIGLGLAVVVRLLVQVAAALGAEAGAAVAAQDLHRQLEHDRVARPRGEVEPVVDEVRRPQLVRLAGTRRLV